MKWLDKIRFITISLLFAIGIMLTITACSNDKILAEQNLIKKVNGLKEYAPVVLQDDNILYTSLSPDGNMIFGRFNVGTETQKEIGTVKQFYMSQGIPVCVDNTAYMPVALNNMEHQLLKIDLSKDTLEAIPFAGGSEAIDYISATATDVYILARDKNSDTTNRSLIYKYSAQSKELLEFVLKESDQDSIVGLSCYNNKLFTVAEKSDGVDTDVCIEIYDCESGTLTDTIQLSDTLKQAILQNGLVQFNAFNHFLYFRDFSDRGYIAAINSDGAEEIFDSLGLRAVSGSNENDSALFFVRESNIYYFMNGDGSKLSQVQLVLSSSGSIRSMIADEKNIFVSILDESNDSSYSTESSYLFNRDYLQTQVSKTIYQKK
ncbi:hypothetical protein OBV_44360 [Oscillibacter valericigenes Sjm18-20]|nr:hypothetical protein OBV_44360 [Oscillibacter valericigenes Sjm18-20]